MCSKRKRRNISFPSNNEVWFLGEVVKLLPSLCPLNHCLEVLQALESLTDLDLEGNISLEEATVSVHAAPGVLHLLYKCGLGTGAIKGHDDDLAAPCKLSLEEAFFLQHVLRCLKVIPPCPRILEMN
jgi:hypothetical protein